MSAPVLLEVAKVMAKGQITLPRDIRQKLSVETGDRVALIWDTDRVVMMNPALYAMRMLQAEMVGKAEEAGFPDEDSVTDYVTEMRREARRA
ncbi:MAG: AbrB/MazE/SpoVT family DNA-binding domain-containing protein [Propionibacteriaceae bacterium]|nr:AbrB/MazE/SpoVT family DNA-binding domain-containing protein [Propionibacteriaceae bacterium]